MNNATLSNIANILGVSVVEDTSMPKNHCGYYDPQKHSIVLRDVNDTQTICHELWHAFDELGMLSYSTSSNTEGEIECLYFEGKTYEVDEDFFWDTIGMYPDHEQDMEALAFMLQDEVELLIQMVLLKQDLILEALSIR